MPAQNVAMKAVVTPILIGGASLAGRRYGHHVGGWLVALPLTSGPVAFFLAIDQGVPFAAGAAVGMLAATSSQVAFALAYGSTAGRGAGRAFLGGCAAFAAATLALSLLHWAAEETFALVAVTLAVGYAVTRRRVSEPPSEPIRLPRWDIPVRIGRGDHGGAPDHDAGAAPRAAPRRPALAVPGVRGGAGDLHPPHPRRYGRRADAGRAAPRPDRAGRVLPRPRADAADRRAGRVRDRRCSRVSARKGSACSRSRATAGRLFGDQARSPCGRSTASTRMFASQTMIVAQT